MTVILRTKIIGIAARLRYVRHGNRSRSSSAILTISIFSIYGARSDIVTASSSGTSVQSTSGTFRLALHPDKMHAAAGRIICNSPRFFILSHIQKLQSKYMFQALKHSHLTSLSVIIVCLHTKIMTIPSHAKLFLFRFTADRSAGFTISPTGRNGLYGFLRPCNTSVLHCCRMPYR